MTEIKNDLRVAPPGWRVLFAQDSPAWAYLMPLVGWLADEDGDWLAAVFANDVGGVVTCDAEACGDDWRVLAPGQELPPSMQRLVDECAAVRAATKEAQAVEHIARARAAKESA